MESDAESEFIGSIRNLPFQCEFKKNGDRITIVHVSSMESESQGSESFLFLYDSVACDQSELEAQAEESANHIAHSQSLYARFRVRKKGSLPPF